MEPQIQNAFQIAASKIGLNERDQQAALADFMATGGQNLDPATTAWCAAFVNASLQQAGQQGTGKLNARSFMEWGQPVDQPQKGDIAVFSRGDPNGWQGHVGFYDGTNEDGTIRVLGGNQGDAVSIANYDASRLLGFRRAGDAPLGGMGSQNALAGLSGPGEPQLNALAQAPQPQQFLPQINMLDPRAFMRPTRRG